MAPSDQFFQWALTAAEIDWLQPEDRGNSLYLTRHDDVKELFARLADGAVEKLWDIADYFDAEFDDINPTITLLSKDAVVDDEPGIAIEQLTLGIIMGLPYADEDTDFDISLRIDFAWNDAFALDFCGAFTHLARASRLLEQGTPGESTAEEVAWLLETLAHIHGLIAGIRAQVDNGQR